MKTFYRILLAGCFLLGFGSTQMYAQNEPTMAEQIEHLFGQLDFTEVTSDVLYDFGMDYFNWRIMNGRSPNDSVVISAEQWGWLCFQASSSGINDYDPVPDAAPYFAWANKLPSDPDTVALGVIHLDYHYIREDAITAGLLTFNATDTLLEDVFPRLESPYQRDTMIAVAALRKVYQTKDLNFLFADSLFFGNMSLPATLDIDAGDGLGWRSIGINTPLAVSYADTGDYVVIVRFNMPGGDQRYGRTNIRIEEENNQFGGGFQSRYSPSPDDNMENVTGCTMNIFYANACGQIRKPFIFIEGWNPNLPGLENDDYDEMIDRLHQPGKIELFNGNTLWEHLDAEGYDIIFVDFDDGGGDLYVNADVVRGVVDWVNAQKASVGSQHKNIIAGASMGGVCGFMALKEMEMEGVDTETELFITYDSPLRGANGPIGLQAMVGILGNTTAPNGKKVKQFRPELAGFEAMLTLPSAKQMLYLNFFNPTGSLTEWHDDFYENIHSNGPLFTPHIAISNGSGIGATQNLFPGQQFLKLSENWIFENYLVVGGGFKLDYAEVYLLNNPNSSWITVYKQKFRKYFHFLIAGYYIVETIPFHVQSDHLYDHAPGGNANFGLGDALKGADYLANNGVWSFVPTVSALNIPNNPNPITSIGNDCGGGAVMRCNFSVDASVINPQTGAAEHNQKHVSINRTQTDFLANLTSSGEALHATSPLSSRIYNFGSADLEDIPTKGNAIYARSTPTIIEKSVNIVDQGGVWINRHARISFIEVNTNLFNDPSTPFEVHIVPDCHGNETIVNTWSGGSIRIGEASVGSTGKLISHPLTAINVEDGGLVLLEKGYNNNIILQGGNMQIKSGGLVRAEHGSRIIVREGSTLTVRSGGTLRIAHYSSLIVEAGGRLVLEPGAIIQLWDGPKLQGEGTIHIQKDGELEWQGDIQFLGNGYFQFDAGHIFTLLADFNLTGYNKDCRFIRLNPDAHLNIDGFNMTLTDGLIESIESGSIRNSNGQVELDRISFIGSGKVAILFPTKSIITNVKFVDTGIDIQGFNGDREDNLIANSRFENAHINGLSCNWFTLIDNSFIEGYPAIELNLVDYAYCSGIDMDGENTSGSIAIQLHNTPIFRFHHSNIQDYDIGVNVGRTNENDRTNLFIYGSTISDCGIGIQDPLTDFNIEMPGFENGLVLMDCSRLAGNGEGILGGDLLLSIDAQIHAGSHIGGRVFNNVCLKQKETFTR